MKRPTSRSDMLIAAAAVALYVPAVGRYGLRVAVLAVLSLTIGLGVELVTEHWRKQPAGALGYTAWLLLPLVLPPGLPLWMGCLSVLFAATVTIAFFGGYGKHPVSPVAVGWIFAAMSFPMAFGMGWSYPFPGGFDGFAQWSAQLPVTQHPIDFLQARRAVPLASILTGQFPQAPGSAYPPAVALLGLILLLIRGTAVRTAVGYLAAFGLLTVLLPDLNGHALPHTLLVGELLIVAFFVLGDPRTSARTVTGRWVVGILAGIVAFLIRHFASLPDGPLFAVLVANIFTPLVDEGVLRAARKEGDG